MTETERHDLIRNALATGRSVIADYINAHKSNGQEVPERTLRAHELLYRAILAHARLTERPSR